MMIGCTTAPRQNLPLDQFSKYNGYRFSNIAAGDNNSDSLFVVLTFSGGGQRAAALALGVLQKLRDTGIVWEGKKRSLLDEVDVISSVSGGSLTAAYYGLFGDRIFEDFAEHILNRNYTGTALKYMLYPASWPKLASPYYDRLDLMADKFMDKDVFEQKTFVDLLKRNQRPFLIINSTDMSLGRSFSFTQSYFDMLYSDLGEYPVGYAVAASGAFPGVFPPLTLQNYDNKKDYELPDWAQNKDKPHDGHTIRHPTHKALKSYIRPGRPYIHLIDGGVSDNLGLIPVIMALDGTASSEDILPQRAGERIQKIVIMTVNARINVYTDWDTKPNVPNLFKVLKKSGITPMENYSQGQIEYLKMLIKSKSENDGCHDQKEPVLMAHSAGVKKSSIEGQGVAYYFIEVSFDSLSEEEDLAYINKIRTFNQLSQEDIHRLCSAAGKILDGNPTFKALTAELQ